MKRFFWFLSSIWIACTVQAQNSGVVAGQYLVQLQPATSLTSVWQGLANEPYQVHCTDTLSARLRIYLLEVVPATAGDDCLKKMQQLPEISLVQANHTVELRETFPDDPFFVNQWNLYNDGSSGGVAGADTDATLAWDLQKGGNTIDGDTIVLAVVDDGFFLEHNDLWFRKNYGETPGNALDDDNNGYVDDFNGWNSVSNNDALPVLSHGTHVSGIAGAKGDNLYGIAGVNWTLQILPLSIGTGSILESNVVECYGYVFAERERYNQSGGSEGSFIVATNASFGIDAALAEDYPLWCAMYDSLGSIGVMSVGATANSNVNVDVVGDMPTSCPSDYLITVNSVTKSDTRSSSGFGSTTIDLAAPGSLIYSTISGNSYNYQSGTSMASPHVAGTIALMLADACQDFIYIYKTNPTEALPVLKNAILNSVTPMEALDTITVSGGRLNIYQSLTALRQYCDTLVGIHSNSPTQEIKLWPNPAKEVILVSGLSQETMVRVFDVFGRMVLERPLTGSPALFPVDQLSSGTYICQFIRDQEALATEVIIIE